MRLSGLGLILALSFVWASVAHGASGIASEGQKKFSKVESGQVLVVKMHKGMGPKVKGSFLSSDAEGIRLLTKDGREQTVAWERIRKVKPKRKRTGFWIGMATGAAVAGAAILGSDDGAGPAWNAAWVGIGAGTFGVFGASVDASHQETIYEAPKTEAEHGAR